MQFQLSDQQLEIQQRARRFAADELAPIAREIDEKGQFPLHLVPRLGELGFLSGSIGADYGGQGFDYLSMAIMHEEIGRIESNVRGFLAVHTGLVSLCINDWGSEGQKQTYLPRLATGDMIGCYCLTEPEAGSDAGSIQTSAIRDGDDWLLNGQKIWITNGNIAHLAIVFATIDPAQRHRGITAFLVETDNPGFKRTSIGGQELGHRGSDHAIITFEDCRVPAANVLGAEGEGFSVAMAALDHGRLSVAAGAVGIGQACLDASLDFARTRRQFGQRIGDFEMIQAALSDMASDIEAARLLTYRAAWMKQEGLPTTRETSMAKLFATEAAVKAASEAVLIHGGRGYSNEYPVERYYRDIKGLQIYEGTSHIQRIVIARDMLGRDPQKKK